MSGNACGVFAAAMWKSVLELVRNDEWKYTTSDPVTEKILNTFYSATNYTIECREICGRKFNTIDEHIEFMKNGGCDKLINTMSQL